MLLALSSKISQIDRFAEEELGIPTVTLMSRAGAAIAEAVRTRVSNGARVTILAGKGNNGGDGYAAATLLIRDYSVLVYDVLGEGQKNECGKYFLEKYKEAGGRVEKYEPNSDTEATIKASDCIVDAIFGTGFSGAMPEVMVTLARTVNETQGAVKIAVDVPLGVNADTGSVNTTSACTMHATVVLSFIKPGLVSYPAKSYVGDIVFDGLGLPLDKISESFDFNYYYLDGALAESLLPERPENSNKGSFGKLLCITGSDKYRGAGKLSVEAALRGGVGYVTYLGEEVMCDSLFLSLPEAIYKKCKPIEELSSSDVGDIVELSAKHSAVLIGSGSGDTEGLRTLVLSLLLAEGGPLVIDADGINCLCKDREESLKAIRTSKRTVILTPHPLEFSRLCGDDVTDIQLHRIESAMKFAAENRCILVLKGAGTVITDGKTVYINSSGSSALAKAGSGDVLAGFLASMVATGCDPLGAAALSVYYHGLAAESLAKSLSEYGVIPSDLPCEIARQLSK